MRHLISCAAIAVSPVLPAAPAAPAPPAAVVNVWPAGKMPGKGAGGPESRHSPERTDAIRITNVTHPTLSLFPAAGNDRPAMIICPGGAYNYVVSDKEGSEVAGWLNRIGVTGIVLKYRVPQNREGALHDVQRALSLVRARAGEWKIDPGRLGVIGFSAGGHLAARASTLHRNRSYAPVDEIDRQSCRPDLVVLVYPAYLDGPDLGLPSEADAAADIPPTLVIHSDDDTPFVAGSRQYVLALRKRKVGHRFLCYPTGGHGYGLHSQGEAKVWPAAAAEWFRTHSSQGAR